jgi:hypothetical protein
MQKPWRRSFGSPAAISVCCSSSLPRSNGFCRLRCQSPRCTSHGWGQQLAGLGPLALLLPEPGEAHRRPQFPGRCLLTTGHVEAWWTPTSASASRVWVAVLASSHRPQVGRHRPGGRVRLGAETAPPPTSVSLWCRRWSEPRRAPRGPPRAAPGPAQRAGRAETAGSLLIPSRGSSRPDPLDHHPIRNGGVLKDDHNAIADHEAQVFLVGLLHVGVIHNADMAPNAGVFVHNRFVDRRVGPHA